MSEDHVDILLAQLRDELAIAPSPDFAARVRVSLEAAGEPRRGWTWLWLGAVASVAVVTCVVLVRTRLPLATTPSATPAVAEGRTVVPETVGTQPEKTTAVRRPRGMWNPAVRKTTARDLPEVLVSPDEGNALRRLLLAIKEGRASVPPRAVATDPETGELLPLQDIVIPPLVFDQPDGRIAGSGSQKLQGEKK